ncbi:hypothetical protein F5887DRAFT_888652, partial [Amanita rubescens]
MSEDEGEQELEEDVSLDLNNAEDDLLPDSDNEEFHSKFTDRQRSSNIKLALRQKLIASIRNARLNDDMDANMIAALQNPPHTPPDIDQLTKLSISLYLSMYNGSEAMYKGVMGSLSQFNKIEIHSLHDVKKTIRKLTGVLAIETDMCINSCLAYTGPFSSLQACPHCAEPRYHEESVSRKRVPRQTFSTIPLGPQLQALYRSPESADRMHY